MFLQGDSGIYAAKNMKNQLNFIITNNCLFYFQVVQSITKTQ